MKIRRYMGKDTQEAIMKVKMDLGNDAIILNTRKVRQKGITKIFSKPMVEVLAATDDEYGGRRVKPAPKQEEKLEPNTAYNQLGNKTALKDEKFSELENKVSNMESVLKKIYSQMQKSVLNSNTSIVADVGGKSEYPKYLQLFFNNLIKNEVEEQVARNIIDLTAERISENGNINDAASVIYKIINDMLGKPETINLREDGKPTIIVFVGSTGVGKTTTVAKIAASYAINGKKNVGLITADTYRIAAVEQLKTYAEILGMPISVVYSPAEVKDSINGYMDKDIILIDTPGRSYNDKSQCKEIVSLVNEAQPDEVFLLLNTTSSMRHSKQVISTYGQMKDYKLIFTKIDESPVFGNILNVRQLTDKKLSYITTGQSVPDDIEVADIDKLTKNLLGSIS